MIRADLAEVVVVEAAHRRGRRPEPDPGGDRRWALVERHRVAVHRDRYLVQTLLGGLAGPLGGAEIELHECVSVPPVRTPSPPLMSSSARASAFVRTWVW